MRDRSLMASDTHVDHQSYKPHDIHMVIHMVIQLASISQTQKYIFLLEKCNKEILIK